MDSNLIYEKTAAGEAAMRQRTRLALRHLRMVLILVDGHTSVADLGEKVGNLQLVEEALAELEKEGFIAPLLEQPSVWQKGIAAVQRVKTTALEQFSSFGGNSRQEKVASAAETGAPGADAPAAPAPAVPPVVSWLAGWPGAEAEGGGKEKPPAGHKAGEVTAIRPIRRGKAPLGPLAKTAWALLAIVALALGTVLFYPYDNHRPAAEAMLTQALQQPVTASRLRLALFPRPSLVLEGVRLGEEGIAVARLHFLPELAQHRHLRQVVLEGLQIPVTALPALPQWLQEAADAGLRFGEVQLQDVALLFGSTSVGPLAGHLYPDGGEGAPLLSLQTAERSLSMEVLRQAGGLQLSLEAQGWEPRAGGPRLDALQARGVLTQDGMRFANVELRALDGQMSGSLALDWKKEIRLEAEGELRHLSVARLAQWLQPELKLRGTLDGSLKLAAQALEWSRLLSQLQGEGAVTVSRGSLPVDLAEAVRRASGDPLRGGETRFDELSGKVRFDARGRRFSELQLSAGLLRAVGSTAVGNDGKLDGTLEVTVGKGGSLRMALQLGGTVADPLLRGVRR